MHGMVGDPPYHHGNFDVDHWKVVSIYTLLQQPFQNQLLYLGPVQWTKEVLMTRKKMVGFSPWNCKDLAFPCSFDLMPDVFLISS